ncbi:MAG: SUMF1/EgtB/PvdO family nonheme iron enzyme [Blastocatellia bacterium]|nr:SUMF1/EgtB/PvdO family nonheme iron enzyme [Blastocatellia bacterium]
MDKFEVTNQDYLEFIKDTKHIAPSIWTSDSPKPGTEKMPVTGISLMDAKAFAEWKAKKTGFAYRLPKEAEWELAARGAKGRNFPWGDEWKTNLANVKAAEGRLANVGSFTQGNSPEGVADLLGNVAEWIDEPLKVYPNGKAVITAELWVVRGGAMIVFHARWS